MTLHNLLLSALLVFPSGALADDQINPFAGLWWDKDKSIVYRAAPCKAGLCVSVVGLKRAAEKKMCGMQILSLSNWVDAKRRWEGTVTDPDSGKQYPATLETGKNGSPTMKAGWGVLSFTDSWTRYAGTTTAGCELHGAGL